jgi:hypothetical protein
MYRIEVKVTDPSHNTEGGHERLVSSLTTLVTREEAYGPHGTEFAEKCIAAGS